MGGFKYRRSFYRRTRGLLPLTSHPLLVYCREGQTSPKATSEVRAGAKHRARQNGLLEARATRWEPRGPPGRHRRRLVPRVEVLPRCGKGAESSRKKLRLPEVTTELSDDEFANPEPRWAHKSCCDSIRQVASAKRAAAASEPQRMTLRNAEPKPEREVRPAQGGWSTHDKQGTSGEPSVYWSSIQSGDRRRSLEATGGPGAASCDETLAPWRSEAGGEESAQQISPPTASGVLSEHVQIFAPYQLGGLAT